MTRVLTCCLLATLCPAAASAQPDLPPAAERLSLDAAIRLALDNNRQLRTAVLEIDKAQQDVAVARTRRLPVFETEVSSSQLLTPVGFSFPKGAFGEFPSTGPIPSADTTVSVPRQPTLYISSQVSQPLSQLKRIGLGIRSAGASLEIERERVRGQQLALVGDVKRLYFAILQTASALAATEHAISLYHELERTLQVRVTQRVALRSDALDVQYRLAQEELTKTTRQNALASQKEQLNQASAQLAAVAGDKYSYRELDDYTDLIARSLKTLPMVSKVTRTGLLEERVYLEYSQERLALRLSIESDRWAGVPFHLRTGARLAATATEIVVRLRHVDRASADRSHAAGYFRFRCAPTPSIEVVTPMFSRRASEPTVEYGGERLRAAPRSALEDIFTDAVRGTTARFARRDHVEDAWRIVSPLLDDESPVFGYETGSWGPIAVNRSITPAGGWVNPSQSARVAHSTVSRSVQAARL